MKIKLHRKINNAQIKTGTVGYELDIYFVKISRYIYIYIFIYLESSITRSAIVTTI